MRKVLPLCFALALTATGCKRARITGRVEDILGQPISGVTVTIVGSTYKTVTDRDGKYQIPYTPGTFVVMYDKEEFHTERVQRMLSVKDSFPAADVTMYPAVSRHVVCATRSEIARIGMEDPFGGSAEDVARRSISPGAVLCFNGTEHDLKLTIAIKRRQATPYGGTAEVEVDEPVHATPVKIGSSDAPAYKAKLLPKSHYTWVESLGFFSSETPTRYDFYTKPDETVH